MIIDKTQLARMIEGVDEDTITRGDMIAAMVAGRTLDEAWRTITMLNNQELGNLRALINERCRELGL